jgi:hypothetical protein
VQKANPLIVRPDPGFRVQHPKSRRGKSGHLRSDIHRLEGDVMNALSLLFDEALDDTITSEVFQQLDLCIALLKKSGFHAFAGHGFPFVAEGIQ